MKLQTQSYVLTLACPNRPGIVAAVSTCLFEAGANILDAQQFDDTQTDQFFMRVVFDFVGAGHDIDEVRSRLDAAVKKFGMRISLRARTMGRRVLLLVSKFDHCL